jgi:tRNA pseudouridine38-40 synthase
MHMVRNLVGMLVDIGRHARTVEELPADFEAKDRGSAGEGAPAHGLMLMSVHYDEDEDPFDEM